jgi:ATP-binding cassette subfamily B protein
MAIIETVGISIIMPFISMANDFSLITHNYYYNKVFNYFNFSNEIYFLVGLGISIILFYIIRAILNALYLYLVMNFTFTRYDKIVNKLFKIYLNMPYKNFIEKNTSYLTKMILEEASNITELVKSTLLLMNELFVFLLIYSVLLFVNYKIVFIITTLISITSYLVYQYISKSIKKQGLQREESQKEFYETLNKAFNNIKMIKLLGINSTLDDLKQSSKTYTNLLTINTTIQHYPRLIFEAFAFTIVIIVIIYILLSNNTNISAYYATITVFILGLYRLLPSMTRIFLNFNNILFYYKSLTLIYDDYLLENEIHGNDPIQFKESLQLENINFSYKEASNIINNLSLEIKKNEKIALIGESGSGKSTLVDIIMGLHSIQTGNIRIDSIKLTNNNILSWREHFGYIPQFIYLFDGTVAENVAFGLKIDETKVIEVLKKTNIWDILEKKNGTKTKVGEGGVMLSGGQKQRIAIARALYKDPDILILDEATSALDDTTEKIIMDEIYTIARDKTLIIIAHRLSTINRCDKVYEIHNGSIQSVIAAHSIITN